MALRAKPSESFFRLAFRGAVGSALAGSIYAAAAPGNAQPAPKSSIASKRDDEPLGQGRCDLGGPLDVHLLRPRIPLDYLSSRGEGRTWTATGLPCRGAMDRKACEADIVAIEHAKAGSGPYLLGTRGDRVLTWDGPKQWLALFAPIEDVATATEYLRVKRIEHALCPVRVADGFLFETVEATETPSRDYSYVIQKGVRRRMHLSADGKLTERWARAFEHKVQDYLPVPGRRPPGLHRVGPPVDGLGSHFARDAMHEAASVHAFTILAAELRALGAPSELAARCEAAAIEEVRHAQQMSRLARRFGSEPERAIISPVPLRSATELAFDNAVEGCVHETYAAVLAVYQARCAEDPAVRAELSTIADDETRHATLSWDIDCWLRPRLTREQDASVARAQLEAVDKLRNLPELLEDHDERRLAGFPSRAHSRQMIDCLAPQLWTA